MTGRVFRTGLMLLCLAAATGCGGTATGGDAAATTASDSPSSAASSSAKPSFPVTIQNCGSALTFDKAPTRVVAMDQIATESLLALGLSGSMVGTAFKNDEIFPSLAGDYAKVKVLAEMYPSKEVLVAAAPDLIVGNIDFFTYSGFPPGTNFTREELTAKGIQSYTLQCQDEQPDPERMFTRFAELASIFGAQGKADEMITQVRASLASTASALGTATPVQTFIYRSGSGPLSTFGGGGGSDHGLTLSGGKNIFGDKDPLPPPEVSVEAVVQRNPEVILISDEDETSPEKKIAYVSSALSTTPAVRGKRFCTIDFYAYGTIQRLARDVNVIGSCLHPEVTFPSYP